VGCATVDCCCRLCAPQKFAESLLEVADNLESAARAVPPAVVQQGAAVAPETALKYLRALLEGVQATERVLLKVRARQAAARGVCACQRPAMADDQANAVQPVRPVSRRHHPAALIASSFVPLPAQTMATKGVQRIPLAEGDTFDPNTQEAMSMVPRPGPDAAPNSIANVWQVCARVRVCVLGGGGGGGGGAD
jgi:hypothetical protein